MAGLPRTVPRPLDSFIGRAEELDTVKGLLATHRLVTLTGPAGIGKTRLAIRSIDELAPSYPDGLCFVPLVELTDSAVVPQAVAAALGLREEPDRSLPQTLTDSLAQQKLLLVWDNCDYLVEGCRALAQILLGACPRVTILATSRRSLHVRGEVLYTVPPFSVPAAELTAAGEQDLLARILSYDAPRLFQERASGILTGFSIGPEEAGAVAQICRRLDGIPLAVELAAGRIRELSATQIAARLDERFHLLTSGVSSLTHQQTLRTAVSWSYTMLSEPERRLLARLSVFAGGWDLEAAEQVCSGGEVTERSVLDLLTGLIDKSWIVGETRGGARRYRLLETVREYSRERLQEGAEGGTEEAAVQARHAAYFLQLAEAAEREFGGAAQAGWLDRLDYERENMRAALVWHQTEEDQAETGLRLAGALGPFWKARGYLSEGRASLAVALEHAKHAGTSSVRAKALGCAGELALSQRDFEATRSYHEECLAIYRQLGDQQGMAAVLNGFGELAVEQGNYPEARRLLEESLALRRQLGDQTGSMVALNLLGNLALEQGDMATAKARYEESQSVAAEIGDKQGLYTARQLLGVAAEHEGDLELARALYAECLPVWRELRLETQVAWGRHGLGYVASRLGDFPAARSLLTESLRMFQAMETTQGLDMTLQRLGGVAVAEGQMQRAARLLAAGASLRAARGTELAPATQQVIDQDVAAVREILGEEAFAAAWAAGAAMTLEQAIAYALREDEPPEPTITHAPGENAPPDAAAGESLPSLLATKLTPPEPAPNLVPRPRLTTRLQATGSRVALVVGSAGSGKSSLVREWCQQQPEGSVAWLSLDPADSDPARFNRYVCAALQRFVPEAATRALLHAPDRSSPERLLTLLLNEVATLEGPVTLVLDDYQEIAGTAVHHLVTFLVEHLPPSLFLILATRSDPPLPLARLRLRGQLIEIRDADLRFTPEEVTRFLNEGMGLNLPPEWVDRLAERTEGWIAGLQLAALTLQSEPDAGGFLEALTHSERYLLDYLSEEVLRRQPSEVRAFLQQTALLDRLCGPLCDAVTDTPGGQAMLQHLVAANLFVIPLDQEQRWYRFHPLFADVLRARLRSAGADEIAALHGRAAAWYEQQGMVPEALEHALAAGQIEFAARLIDQYGPTARSRYPQSEWSAAGTLAEPVIARLEELLERGATQGREATALDARLLLAKLHWQAGRREQAMTALQPALVLTEREEYTNRFVAAGFALIPVLRQAAVQGIAPETVGKLLAAMSESGALPAGARPTGSGGASSSSLAEPLSERELEVLRLVAAGLANAEIAAQLFLAVGTVKRHVFNLYGKLGANSRASAVARARELGLL